MEHKIISSLHSYMTHIARSEQDFVYYSKVIEMAGIRHLGSGALEGALGNTFFDINLYDWEQDADRPMLSAIAVSSQSHNPSGGFYRLARDKGKLNSRKEDDEIKFWIKELTALREYWQNHSETTFKNINITYQAVYNTLQHFNEKYPDPYDYEQWLDKDVYKYALEFGGRLYPPKHILSEVTGISKSDFSGGEPTNCVFRQLGLTIIYKPNINSEDNHYTLTQEERENIAQTMELTFREGDKVLLSGYRYERDIQARKVCIKEYGYDCSICNFNFGNQFGEIGKDFIHVHHLKPLSLQGGEYEVNPLEDLRPVCPNCHAMLHKRTPPYSIEELKHIRQQANQ